MSGDWPAGLVGFISRSIEIMQRNRIVLAVVSSETNVRNFFEYVVAAFCNDANTVIISAFGQACNTVFDVVRHLRSVKCGDRVIRVNWLFADDIGALNACIAEGIRVQGEQR